MINGAAGPSVQSLPGLLTVTDPRLFSAEHRKRAELFARRVMRFPEVQSLEIDPVPGRAILRYRVFAGDCQALVCRFANAMTEEHALPPESLPAWPAGEPVTLFRHGESVTTLRIVASGNSRFEARHPSFPNEPGAARRVEAVLIENQGILHVAVADATVRVRFDPDRISVLDVVRQIEAVVRRIEAELPAPADLLPAQPSGEVQFGLANTSLGVTTLAEFALPALTPVGAGLVIFAGARAVRTATLEFCDGKLGLPALYASILAVTLLSGQFFTAALMFWCLRKWEERYRQDLEAETQAMLDESLGMSEEALAIAPGGLEQALPWRDIAIGQRLCVRKGERIPADARVFAGVALVDEAILCGDPGLVRRLPGDEVLAGTRLLAGELCLEAIRTGRDTRAARVARTLVSSTIPVQVPGAFALNPQADTFAGRMVAPTIAAAGLGLVLGDVTMSGAILRPDYATGVGLAAPLESIRDARIALRRGALIRSRDAMARLARGSWVVLEDHENLGRADIELAEIRRPAVPEHQLLPAVVAAGLWLGDPRGPALARACRERRLVARKADLREIDANGVAIEYGKHVLWLRGQRDPAGLMPLQVEVDGRRVAELRFRRCARPEAAVAVRRLQRAGMRLMLCSDREPAALAPLAASLGVDRYRGRTDADSRRDLLRSLGKGGARVVHVHTGGVFRDPGDRHLSVALAGCSNGGTFAHDADIVLFGRSIGPLPDLAALARDSVARAGQSRRLAMAPNLFCVAGAVAFGFTGLAVVVISNLGTSIVYNRARRALQSVSDSDSRLSADTWHLEEGPVTDHGATDVNPSAR